MFTDNRHNASKLRDDDCQASASMMSSQCPDTGIQVAHKQTSIESGYNVFDEIIWKTGFQTGMTPYLTVIPP
ncbi:hypothetical protein COM42_005305, partial [Wolbachia pipientis]